MGIMRRTGKTTRLVDLAIQHFFENGEITILTSPELERNSRERWRGLSRIGQEKRTKFIDPDEHNSNNAQSHFIRIFEQRLFAEHGKCFEKRGYTYHLINP